MVEASRPIPYIVNTTRTNADGKRIYFCTVTEYRKMLTIFKDMTKKFTYGDIVFSTNEVKRIEQLSPELTWPMDGPREVQLTHEEKYGTDFELVNCYDLPKRWECDLLDVLIIFSLDGSNIPYIDSGCLHSPLIVEDLYSMDVVLSDLLIWEAANSTILECFKLKAEATNKLSKLKSYKGHDIPGEIMTEMDCMKKLITQLKSKNQRLTAEIKALKSTGSNESPLPIPKTANASAGVQDKAAKNWAESLEKAVSLAIKLSLAGKPKSTVQHKAMWAELWGETKVIEPRKEAFRAFRLGLPSSLKGD
jgi:hypothetical protein